MKKLIMLSVLASTNALATPPTPVVSSVVSTMNGSIDVGTFVSAAPNQYQTQTSIGSLTGSTVVSGTTTVPITSSITGAASSVSSGTGITHPSFVVNGSPASAVVQGVVNTTITNYPLVTTTIVPDHHDDHHDD